ncbi:MAG: response regulator transcription factor, partial [Pirellulaceae bacterium]
MPPSAPAVTRPRHILVVEDEEHLAIGIKFNLEAEGYLVTTVTDGASALKLLEDDPSTDLVVLDLMLPGMSGYAVCETLRRREMDIPILMLSARTLAEDRTRGFNVGADQYLSKPFDLDELLSRIRNLLLMYDRRMGKRPENHAAGRTFSFSNATVNFDTYDVQVDKRPVKLTQLEMKLLQYFIDNEGRVISRNELLENVWDMPATITTRAVDQFIRRLRKTFEPYPACPRHFLTIRDAGSRFVAAGITGTAESMEPS